jgi:lipopolysaccharide export system permease protein
MIKKIDRLLFTSFILPFAAAFLIAMFVLLMQTLWLYIDDIAGKGLGFFLVVELLAYKCVALIPLALPIAILISSVMVMGNLAENYELSSFKSAGVPLLRIMRPILFCGLLTMMFSYYCANYLMPIANLKFGSRMYDIQRQKPALRLDAGVFNYDFQGYAIHIGEKGYDGKAIKNVLIYDHSETNNNEFNQIIAREGEMYATTDGHYFIMNLRDGHQYIESRPSRSASEKYPFVRTSFQEWVKVFDLSEFQLSRTDAELFKSNRSWLTIDQLKKAIDSISVKIREREVNFSNVTSNYFYFEELDSTFLEPEEPDSVWQGEDPDLPEASQETESVRVEKDSVQGSPPDSGQSEAVDEEKASVRVLKKPAKLRPAAIGDDPVAQAKGYPHKASLTHELDSLESFQDLIATFPQYEQKRLYTKAKTSIRSIRSQAEAAMRFLGDLRESRVKHIYDLHTKYSMAVVCLIFVFIGAPMGAIVRKGGFGYPILVSIFFFMLFVIMTIFCRKIAESFILPAALAGWVPNIVLLPIGIVLTVKAMNDSKLLNADRYINLFVRIFHKREKQE